MEDINQKKIEIFDKMQEFVESDKEKQDNIGEKQLYDWLKNLPPTEKDQYLIDIVYNSNVIIFCLRELNWIDAHEIESASYRYNNTTKAYFYSGEHEKREKLRKAIVWVAESETEKILYNNDKLILQKIDSDIIETFWVKYTNTISLNIDDAKNIYECAYKYFRGEIIEDIPIPTCIIETDLLIQFGKMNLEEIRNMKESEIEKIKLVLSARAKAVGLYELNNFENKNLDNDSVLDAKTFMKNFKL